MQAVAGVKSRVSDESTPTRHKSLRPSRAALSALSAILILATLETTVHLALHGPALPRPWSHELAGALAGLGVHVVGTAIRRGRVERDRATAPGAPMERVAERSWSPRLGSRRAADSHWSRLLVRWRRLPESAPDRVRPAQLRPAQPALPSDPALGVGGHSEWHGRLGPPALAGWALPDRRRRAGDPGPHRNRKRPGPPAVGVAGAATAGALPLARPSGGGRGGRPTGR